LWNVKEFNHKLIEVSNLKIGIKLPEVMESRSAVLGSHSESDWKYGKIEHENGLKFLPSLKKGI